MPTITHYYNPMKDEICINCDKPFKLAQGNIVFNPSVCKGENPYKYDFKEGELKFVCWSCLARFEKK